MIAEKMAVTQNEGSRSASDCKERCPAGRYYDEDNGSCRSCGFGFYQPSNGSFSCLLCGLGKTTPSTEAVSKAECKEQCKSGQQLSADGK